MAKIRPFQGLRYDLPKAGAPEALLAPPYDVIDGARRAELAGKSDNNCVHVILPEADDGDSDPDAKYAAGSRAFRGLVDRALTRDTKPSLYVYHQTFELDGSTYVRKGMVALIELTRFGEGPVLPHERTLSGPKADRLKLMRACDAHLELVFGLFSDPAKDWEAAVADSLGEPVLDCRFESVDHTLYRVDDPEVCARVASVLEPSSIYIADGHHRYETMCAFADELESAGRGESSRWGMIYLSNLEDEGLVVLPTHRIVHGLTEPSLAKVLEIVAPWFDISDGPLPENTASLRDHLIRAGEGGAAFGLSVPGSGRMHTLVLRADYDPADAGLADSPAALQRLDVALLHELVLERALGIDKAAQAAKTNLRYFKSSDAALDVARGSVDGDGAQMVCFMNATPVADVVAVCDSGEVMPQKSTFFHPKIPTGLVFHDLGGGDGG